MMQGQLCSKNTQLPRKQNVLVFHSIPLGPEVLKVGFPDQEQQQQQHLEMPPRPAEMAAGDGVGPALCVSTRPPGDSHAC